VAAAVNATVNANNVTLRLAASLSPLPRLMLCGMNLNLALVSANLLMISLNPD